MRTKSTHPPAAPGARHRVAVPAVSRALVLVGLSLSAATARAAPPPAPLPPVQRTSLANGLRVVLAPDHGARAVVVASSCRLGGGHGEAAGRVKAGAAGTRSAADRDEGAEQILTRLGSSSAQLLDADVASRLLLVAPAAVEQAIWHQARLLAGATTAAPSPGRTLPRWLIAGRVSAPTALGQLGTLGQPRLWALALGPAGARVAADTARRRSEWRDTACPPKRAVLTLVGDFEPARALAAARRYLAPLSWLRGAPAPTPRATQQHSRRSSSLRLGARRWAGLTMGWVVASTNEADRATLVVTAALIGSALSALPVKPNRGDSWLPLSASARAASVAGRALIEVQLMTPPSVMPQMAVERVEQVARALGGRGPSAAALTAARHHSRNQALRTLTSWPARAHRLGAAELRDGDARTALTLPDALLAVSAAQVKQLAASQLLPSRSDAIELLPTRPRRSNVTQQERRGRRAP